MSLIKGFFLWIARFGINRLGQTITRLWILATIVLLFTSLPKSSVVVIMGVAAVVIYAFIYFVQLILERYVTQFTKEEFESAVSVTDNHAVKMVFLPSGETFMLDAKSMFLSSGQTACWGKGKELIVVYPERWNNIYCGNFTLVSYAEVENRARNYQIPLAIQFVHDTKFPLGIIEDIDYTELCKKYGQESVSIVLSSDKRITNLFNYGKYLKDLCQAAVNHHDHNSHQRELLKDFLVDKNYSRLTLSQLLMCSRDLDELQGLGFKRVEFDLYWSTLHQIKIAYPKEEKNENVTVKDNQAVVV